MTETPDPVADPGSTVVRRGVRVTGRVQNVTYRESTRQEAERLGLAGWVRNRPDGSVEAEVEGPERGVDDLLSWMHDGPPSARVETVRVDDVPPTGDVGFRVR